MTNSLLTDNKERDSIFKEIDCTGKNNNFLKNVCLDKVTDNRKHRSQKNKHMQRLCQVHKNIGCEPVKDIQKIGRNALVGNESIDLEGTYARLTDVGSISKDQPFPTNIFSLCICCVNLFFK